MMIPKENHIAIYNHDFMSVQQDRELSMDESLLAQLEEVIHKNLTNAQFSVEDLAAEVALSRSHLHRKLNRLTGKSISQFIRNIRLTESMALLQKDVATVSEIAYRVGFGSSTYFIKCFHDQYGYSPGEVKRKVTEGWYQNQDQNKAEDPDQTNVDNQVISPLEALHPASSESLIREIFDSMVVFKPELEKFLLVDEGEGETIDMRLLAYQIIKCYPWPIGVELRRLFSVSLRNPGQERLQQLQKTITRNIRLLSYIVFNELILASQKNGSKSEISIPNISDIFKSWDINGNISLLKESAKYIGQSGSELFIKQLKAVLDTAFFRELSDWIEIKREIEQGRDHDYAELCRDIEQTLIFILKKTAFLVKYKLVNIGSIKVQKARFKSATFEHQMHLLNSIDTDFKIHEELLDQFSDSNSVLLMKSVKEPNQFLNLSPFVIDTHHEVINKQKLNLKRDIYLLECIEGNDLKYTGSESNSTEDLSSLDHYDELLAEYKEIIKLMSK